MSRIAKQPIILPTGVTAVLKDGRLTVTGPQGTLTRPVRPEVTMEIAAGQATVKPVAKTRLARMLWGTYASHLKNMIAGVTKGFSKQLIIEGIGYKVAVSGNNLVLNIGYSHPVNLPIPPAVKVTIDKTNITVSGIDKEVVGQFAATLRAEKPTEPYKGKGIRYLGEVIRRKQGKKAAATAAA